eukprot:131202-Prymnesium_polylepis.1
MALVSGKPASVPYKVRVRPKRNAEHVQRDVELSPPTRCGGPNAVHEHEHNTEYTQRTHGACRMGYLALSCGSRASPPTSSDAFYVCKSGGANVKE